MKIEASILSADFARLGEQVQELAATGLVDRIHIDVMDGHFVPNISIGLPVVESLRAITTLPLAVHLMISSPEKYLERFVDAGAQLVWVHCEASHHLNRDMQVLRELGATAGVSLNPATPVSQLGDILEDVESVLVMSVNPGFGGQRFLPSALRRIGELRRMIRAQGLAVEIVVDGGVAEHTAADVVQAGADVLVVGSALFRHPQGPAGALAEIRANVSKRRSV
jgi:ribulose-phosphate 3-epimerase